MEITDLPNEMLVKVHQWLPLPALKEAVLVCRLWRKVGEDPSLWKWCTVTVYEKEDIMKLSFGRIKKINEIRINPHDNWDTDNWEAFFLATMELLNLKMIDGLERSGVGARGTVEKGVFARAVVKLEVVELTETPYDQIDELFTEMSRSTKIKKLHLVCHDLSQMDPGLFAVVLTSLEDVCLAGNDTTKEQMSALFKQIIDRNCLRRLHLGEESVSHLEPRLFGRALAKVEDLTLLNLGDDDDDQRDEGQSEEQSEALFTELSDGTQLRKLDLSCFDLSQVSTIKFATALSRLETVGLFNCDFTNDQIEALFTKMMDNNQMKKLALADEDLSQLEPGLLAGVLAKLEDVALISVHLSPPQLEDFFNEASRSTRLKTLDMSDVNLSAVDPEVFAQAVTRLEEVTLMWTSLTDVQWQTLFTKMALSTKLKKVRILGHTLGISSVNPQVLASALNRIDKVELHRPDLTPDQNEALNF